MTPCDAVCSPSAVRSCRLLSELPSMSGSRLSKNGSLWNPGPFLLGNYTMPLAKGPFSPSEDAWNPRLQLPHTIEVGTASANRKHTGKLDCVTPGALTPDSLSHLQRIPGKDDHEACSCMLHRHTDGRPPFSNRRGTKEHWEFLPRMSSLAQRQKPCLLVRPVHFLKHIGFSTHGQAWQITCYMYKLLHFESSSHTHFCLLSNIKIL